MDINLKEIYKEVAIRSYYAGEMPKLEESKLAMIQTSRDTDDMLYGLAGEAFLNVVRILEDRIPVTIKMYKDVLTISFTGGGLATETKQKILEGYIQRYIYSYVLYHWLLTTYPKMAAPFELGMAESIDGIYAIRVALAKKVRRKATNLAGIN